MATYSLIRVSMRYHGNAAINTIATVELRRMTVKIIVSNMAIEAAIGAAIGTGVSIKDVPRALCDVKWQTRRCHCSSEPDKVRDISAILREQQPLRENEGVQRWSGDKRRARGGETVGRTWRCHVIMRKRCGGSPCRFKQCQRHK